MNPTGNCRSCEAPIVWAKTANNRRMPLDPEPVPDGNVWVVSVDQDGTPRIGVALSSDTVP
jgi:hypothetical protein